MNPEVGIPTLDQYRAVVAGDDFRRLERFSDEFIHSHSEELRPYARRWAADPLHQWSRQWEYPFVAGWIARFADDVHGRSLSFLDAGSGITFFPYFLAHRYPGSTVLCRDMDRSLIQLFESVGRRREANVDFRCAGLDRLPDADSSQDFVYCISVLEHTRNEEQILEEFRRVLRPGGLLLLTFDVSLDGESDIEPDRADWLLGRASTRFEPLTLLPPVRESIAQEGIVTTGSIRAQGLSIPPWRHPWLSAAKSVLRGRIPRKLLKELTVYGGAWRKPRQEVGS